jgi:hypothetical protein
MDEGQGGDASPKTVSACLILLFIHGHFHANHSVYHIQYIKCSLINVFGLFLAVLLWMTGSNTFKQYFNPISLENMFLARLTYRILLRFPSTPSNNRSLMMAGKTAYYLLESERQ